jgi:hypothetical protein
MSWQWICPEVIVKGFKQCCISDVMDGSEDDILWEDEEEVENVGSEIDEVGNGNSEGDVVGNNYSRGDNIGNCGDSETNW